MTTINISREHNLGPDDCEEALTDLTRYLEGLGARVDRTGDELVFDGSGFDGDVEICPGTARARIKLGVLARPFRRQLEAEINRHLDARLGDA